MSPFDLKHLLGKPTLIWEKFHDKTKFKKLYPSTSPEKIPKTWIKVFFKEYPRLDRIILPPPQPFQNIKFEKILTTRKSARIFSDSLVSIEQISNLLYYSAGLRDNKPPFVGNRTYPSGGARYPLEVYLISQNSELINGLYHYNLKQHSLEILLNSYKLDLNRYFNQPWIKKAPLILVITAVFDRNTIKYGVRGYRHILQESGHLGQNFYLVATALSMGVSGLGGYLDDRLNDLLNIDGIKESAIYVLGMGNNFHAK